MKAKVVNGTTHAITIYSIEDCDASDPRRLILNPGAKPIYTIEAGKKALNATPGEPKPRDIDAPFPTYGPVKFEDADPSPDADVVIVSNMYRSACVELGRDTSNLGTIYGAVYDGSSTRPVGCVGIAVG